LGQNNLELGLLLLKIAWFATPLFFAFLYLLTVYLINEEARYKYLDKAIMLLGGITAIIAGFTNYIVKDIKFVGEMLTIVYGQGMLFYLLSGLIIIIATLYPIFRYKHFKDKKVQHLLIGLFIFYVLNFIFNIFLPISWGVSRLYFLGDYSTLILLSFIAYGIVRHKLMDIRLIVARSISYAILIALIGFFYTFTMIWLERIIFVDSGGPISTGQIIFRIAMTLFIVFSFQPLRRFITKKTDRIFFKQSYDPEKLLDTLAHTMGSTIVLIELLYKILNILTSEMKVSRGFFVILKDDKTINTTQGVGYKKSPHINLKEIEIVTKNGLCIFDELDDHIRTKAILRRHKASVAIPLKSNDKVSGVLFLGEKSSGDMYSAQDIRIFEILGPEITVAVNNAKSYEEIQQFNTVLRSEIKKATKDLEVANTNLRELDKAKDEFISMASHQLRTPLTAIKGYLSMLLEGDAGEIKMGQYEFVQEAYYGATRMVSLINDLLNVSRMETGRFFLEVSEFDVVKTVSEEIKQLDKAVKDKGLKLSFKKPKHMTLCADEMKVRQVAMNFIDNAIYYTPHGKIEVKLYEEGKNVCFEVKDNGIGVPKEQQKHLFTKFYRADNARSTRPDGTGLGLFMAKKVIEEHHGDIIFHSEEGKGSTFGFKLPQVSKVSKESMSDFDKSIPLETPIDKAKEVMDEKMKKDVEKEAKKEKVKAGQS
jgi:signal transduction histidine kinase